MNFKRIHYTPTSNPNSINNNHFNQRHFWWLFKKKKKETVGRPGAMTPEQIKKTVKEIGIGNQAEITRIGYDGTIDDMPIMVEIIDISEHGFTGKIVNVERQMIEDATEKLVYAKMGGGTIEFQYDDGDIKDISVSQDEELLKQETDKAALKEILSALEPGDRVIVAYYDSRRKGTINTEGKFMEKSEDLNKFSLQIEKINRIELEKKETKSFDLERDLVIDISIV